MDEAGCHNKGFYISKIVEHFVTEHKMFISELEVKFLTGIYMQGKMCIFVEHIERFYGHSCSALFCEPPFILSSIFVHKPSGIDGIMSLLSLC